MPAPLGNTELDNQSSEPKPPKRKRSNSAFNNFCKGRTKNEGETAKEQFRRFSTQWQNLSTEQKNAFKNHSRRPQQEDKSKKWATHLEYACNELDFCNQIMPTPTFLVYFNPVTKVVDISGTAVGLDILKQHKYVVSRFESFLGAIAEREAEPPQDPEKEVRSLFNQLYRAASGNSQASMPYSKLEEYNIKILGLAELKDEQGRPYPLTLKNPALYGPRQQRLILENSDSLKCVIGTGPFSTSTQSTSPSPSPQPAPLQLSPPPPSPPPPSPPPPPSTPPSTQSSLHPPSSSSPLPSPSPCTSSSSSDKTSRATSTLFTQTQTMVTISHPSNDGSVRAPKETTHVILDRPKQYITAACLIRNDLVTNDPKGVVVQMLEVYTTEFEKGKSYVLSSNQLYKISK